MRAAVKDDNCWKTTYNMGYSVKAIVSDPSWFKLMFFVLMYLPWRTAIRSLREAQGERIEFPLGCSSFIWFARARAATWLWDLGITNVTVEGKELYKFAEGDGHPEFFTKWLECNQEVLFDESKRAERESVDIVSIGRILQKIGSTLLAMFKWSAGIVALPFILAVGLIMLPYAVYRIVRRI